MFRAGVISVLLCSFFSAGLSAQIRLISPSVIDSLANPPLSADAGRVEIRQIGSSPVVMNEDGDVQYIDYRVQNISREDFSIVRVTTTCPCLKPEGLPKIVKAGEQVILKMAYNPKGHPGTFERRMFVYADFSKDSPVAVIPVKVVVKPGKDMPQDGIRLGPLLFKCSEIRFRTGESSAVEAVVANVGIDPVSFAFESRFLPQCIKVEPEKLSLRCGQQAKIKIKYDASLDNRQDAPKRRIMLMVTGLGQAPSKSNIPICIE